MAFNSAFSSTPLFSVNYDDSGQVIHSVKIIISYSINSKGTKAPSTIGILLSSVCCQCSYFVIAFREMVYYTVSFLHCFRIIKLYL